MSAFKTRLQALGQRDFRGLVLPLGLILAWYLISKFNLANSAILASPYEVWKEGYGQISSGAFALDLVYSVSRNLGGFVVGGTAGLILGSLLGVSRWADRLISPSFNTIKSIAIFAWIPLISVWFGMGEPAKIIFIAIAAFYPTTINTYEGIRSVHRDHVEVARVFEFSRWQLFRKVILPSASPQIITGIQLALIYSWLATIGAEYFLKSGHGIANSMIDGREHFNMGSVLFGVVVVGVVGAIVNQLAFKLEKHLLGWRNRTA
ncbi:ABC transporter permease [Chitinibacter tainanensis]|jgi:sulfonate transport system permease protein|uniref:ABC transporter permease n=1 Tax=Chitinibacter tainanensis TaxID=230667 RepID=UPI0023550724|nr:ABC transporter permease [Chitinibacter tainanensis]